MRRIALLFSIIAFSAVFATWAKAEGICAHEQFTVDLTGFPLTAHEFASSCNVSDTVFGVEFEDPFAAAQPTQEVATKAAVQSESQAAVTTLPAPPATIFLLLQGILCIGIVRGRRRWIAVIVAAITIGRAGISMLPRLMQPNGHSSATAQAPGELAVQHAQRTASDAHAPDVSFLGLLRKINAEPPVRVFVTAIVRQNTNKPAAGLPFARPTAGFAVPAEPAANLTDTQSTFAPLPCRGATPVDDSFPFVYARPPPG